jgi:hypothetical protein
MATYHARMLDAETGGEGSYDFEGPQDLMSRTADEIVTVFFDHVEQKILHHHTDWEVNGIMKNRERRVVTAMGSLLANGDEPPLPFLLLISDQDSRGS